MTGLAYLPRDSDVIVGVHLAEWLDDKEAGKPLLDEPRPTLLDLVLKQLPRVTGLPIEEIDHVVLAGSFDKPQVIMVVKTRRRYSLEKIAEASHRSKTPQHQDRAVYEMSLPPWAEAIVWCVEEKTIVCVIPFKEAPKLAHLNGLSATPASSTRCCHRRSTRRSRCGCRAGSSCGAWAGSTRPLN